MDLLAFLISAYLTAPTFATVPIGMCLHRGEVVECVSERTHVLHSNGHGLCVGLSETHPNCFFPEENPFVYRPPQAGFTCVEAINETRQVQVCFGDI